MTHQRDPSPCCNAILYTFASGGSQHYPAVTGPYVECVECHKQYEMDYKTGNLKNQ